MAFSTLNEKALSLTIGKRLQRLRLNANLTQAQLGAKAGLTAPSLNRLEDGKGSQLSSLLRVLRAMGRLDELERVLGEPQASPLELLKLAGRIRRRASGPHKKKRD